MLKSLENAFLVVCLIAAAFLFLPIAKGHQEKLPKVLIKHSNPNGEIKINAKGSHNFILREGEDYHLLVTLSTPKVNASKKLPLNVAIVVDRSGSMADKGKLTYAKEAAKAFIQKLESEDRVSLVEYDETITILSEPVLVGKERPSLLRKIDLLEPRGSTNLAEGMMEGGRQVEKFFDDHRINRVLLLSDGLANTGVSDIGGVSSLAESLTQKGIQVSSFGLGADFDEDMMTRIADVSGGNYYFIESAAQIAGIFEKERYALSSVVGKKVRLVVTLSDQVDLQDVYGYSFDKKGGKIVVDLPDIYSGQNRKILFRLKPDIKEAHQLTVATVTLEYQSVAHDLAKQTATQTVVAEVTRDRIVFEKSVNKDVLVESAKAASAAQMQEAMKSYATGDVGQANSLLGRAKGILQKAYQSAPSPALMEQMRDMDATSGQVNSQAPESEAGKILIKGEKSKARDQQQSW